MDFSGGEPDTVVVIDGITTGIVKHFTPDIGWSGYVKWLKTRRPDLNIIHLAQPLDWIELFISKPDKEFDLIKQMARTVMEQVTDEMRNVVILGFSLGGIRALHVARLVSEFWKIERGDYLTLVTFGTPYKGTGRLADRMLRKLSYDYFKLMLDTDQTKDLLKLLVSFGEQAEMRLLIGEIEHDEVVSSSSSLGPVHWLTSWPLPRGLKWGTFTIETSSPIRAHDGLLNDPLALAYIDGLVDGLLPSSYPLPEYEPIRPFIEIDY